MNYVPKTITLAFAAMLLTATGAAAQNNVLAYNNTSDNKPAAIEVLDAPGAYKIRLTQPSKDSLVFRLALENSGADKVVLTIKDRNSNVLHREVIPATPVYVGRYNLQGLEDGNYTFELRNGKGRIAQKSVEIRTELAVNRFVSVQ